ncbi:hypothetical protein L2E82_50499 [Cichorium intybus]|nr:hypothetical protein L2E82_50499 [Cichorium intybus]
MVLLQGYALIEYESFEEAEKAIAVMDGGELLTQTVNVDWAFSKGPFRRRNNNRRRSPRGHRSRSPRRRFSFGGFMNEHCADLFMHQQSLVANQNKYHSFKYKSGMDSGRNDHSSDQESQYTAAENEEDSRPSLMRRTTIGDGLCSFEEFLEFDLLEVPGMGFYITQPGSSVATSLIDGESKPKHVLLVEIKGSQYRLTKISLNSFVLKDESDIDPNDQNSILEHLDNVVNSLTEKCGRKDSTNSETMLPLIRVKLSVSGLSNLTEFTLKRNNITAKGMSALSGFINLLKLDLERCPLIRGGFEIYFL